MGFVADFDPAFVAVHRKAAFERRGEYRADQRMAAALERHQDRQRIAVDQLAAQLFDAGQYAVGFAEHSHRQVEQVDAGGGHRTGRRFLARQPPVVGGEGEEFVLAEIGLDLQRRAELT